jgi:hypothetical protein
VPRHTTAPAASTTQIDVNSSDTSRPTYCSMAFLLSRAHPLGDHSRASERRDHAM